MEDEGADLLWLDARPLEEVAQASADHLLEGEGEGEGEGSPRLATQPRRCWVGGARHLGEGEGEGEGEGSPRLATQPRRC